MTNTAIQYKELLQESFQAVIRAAHPDHFMLRHIPPPPKGRLVVVGAGKASAAMAAAFEKHYSHPLEGLVITRYGHAVPTSHIRIAQAAHPTPDENGRKAVCEMLEIVANTGPDDLIICLISGGGSSLLSAPIPTIEFSQIQRINAALLKSGASITEMNTVRKHLNIALGGGLAQAASTTPMITLAISDVTGDDPAVIASGATVPDPTSCADALQILKRYNIEPGAPVLKALTTAQYETPKPGDPVFNNKSYHLIATPLQALKAASTFWQDHGYTPYILDAEIEGDTNEQSAKKIKFLEHIITGNGPVKAPCAILSGGETTVKITGHGTGGPNTQFILQSAMLLEGNPRIYAMACDTDGIDGAGDNAGAMLTPDTLHRAKEKSLNPQAYLDDNNSYDFFDAMQDLVITGPSHTNVNDYRVFLINKA